MRSNAALVAALLVAGVAAGAVAGYPAAASTGPCITGPDSTTNYVRVMNYQFSHDSAKWAAVGLPYRPAGGAVVVADSTVCAKALAAYNATLPDTLAQRGITLTIGTRYVFVPQTGSRITNLFFYLDEQFRIIHHSLAI